MAPTPAAGQGSKTPKSATPNAKAPTSAAKNTPKPPQTPTKSTPKGKPTKLGGATPKPETQGAGQPAKQTPGKAAQQAPKQAQQKQQQLQANDSSASDDSDGGDEPMSKVKQAKDDLQEQAPEPIQSADDDDDDDDAVSEARQSAKQTTGDAGDKAKNQAEKAGNKAQNQPKSQKQQVEQAQDDDDDEDDNENDDKNDESDDNADDEQDTAGGALNGVKDAAGKLGKAAKDPSKAKEAAGEAADQAKDTAQDTADDTQEAAGEVKDEATDKAENTKDSAEDAAENAKDTAEDTAEDAKDTAEDTAEDAKDTAEDAAGDAKDTAEDAGEEAKDNADDVGEEATDDAQATGDQAQEQVDSAAEDAQDKAEDAKPELPDVSSLPLDLSVMEGLTVNPDDGLVYKDGEAIGRIAEGDAEDLGDDYPISSGGEILDEDGDLVGRCELLPAEIKRQMDDKHPDELPEGADELLNSLSEQDHGDLPDISVLQGYTCTAAGEIFNDDGDRIGVVEEGDPEELQHCKLNEKGEFVNDDGETLGRARVDPEASHLFQGEHAQDGDENVEDATQEAADQAQDAAGEAQDASEDAQDAAQGIEDQLPGIEALEGRELNESGQIVDPESGDVLANVDEDGDLKEKLEKGEVNAQDLKINENGEVVDADGNVLGHVGLADGAAEKLKDAASIDIRILDGKKINKSGKILDSDGEVIGELSSGELEDCKGKKVTEDGRVLDKDGNELGKASVVPGEAAETAQSELLEELGETAEDQGPKMHVPDLATLDGLKVNKNQKVLDEDGEIIGELVDGDPEKCKGKKCNDKGEVLDTDGSVIGRVKTIERELTPEEIEAGEHQDADADNDDNDNENVEAEAGEQGQDGEAQEGEGEGEAEEEAQDDGLPPLPTLDGLKVNKAGKLVDDQDVVRGELEEGDAKKLAKLGITCDEEGIFWQQGKQIGKAKTVAQEDEGEEAPFAGLDNLVVSKDGWVVVKDTQERVGVVEGDGEWKKLVGRSVDEDGDILSKNGTVVGHAERYEEPEEEEDAPIDLSSLEGKSCTKAGYVMGDDGSPLARVSEGNPKSLSSLQLDGEGQFWGSNGKVVGRVELIPEDEKESEDGIFAGYEGLHVIADGKVADHEDNVVGQIVEGSAKKLIGMAVDSDGEIADKFGQVKGRAEPIPEEEEVDYSILDGLALNKKGLVVQSDGQPIGKLIEGDAAELAGRKCDENGFLYSDNGKVVGKCQPLPPNERPGKSEGPFAGLEGLHVSDKDGSVCDQEGRKVGQVDGDAKRLVGLAVDEDGDILDKNGNVKGHAEPYEEEEEQQEDLSALQGCTVNKKGYCVDGNKTIIGQVVEGTVANLVGKKVGKDGTIWNDSGEPVGRAELVHDQPQTEDGPFAGFEGEVKVQKEGTCVLSSSDEIVGRVIEGDLKKLQNRAVESDGSILDSKGNEIGRAERWEPEEKEKKVSPMSGCKVNKEGEIRDSAGDLLGRLTSGDLGQCVGCEVSDSNNVVDSDGNNIGVATLLENIAEEEEEEIPEDETEEEKQAREQRELAKKMTSITKNTIEQMNPICKKIKERLDQADSTPKEELDEEQLVNDVKPLIEEGGRILSECNGSLKGLDPDGSIAARAKGRAGSGEASPEEHALAENLKDLSTNLVGTIDDAKKRLQKYPHAKKKLNPLWGLLTQPLFGILAAVGILLSSVVALLGQILSLGQFNLLKSVLGHFMGFDKLFGGLDKIKKKAGDSLSSIPVVGGLLGGK